MAGASQEFTFHANPELSLLEFEISYKYLSKQQEGLYLGQLMAALCISRGWVTSMEIVFTGSDLTGVILLARTHSLLHTSPPHVWPLAQQEWLQMQWGRHHQCQCRANPVKHNSITVNPRACKLTGWDVMPGMWGRETPRGGVWLSHTLQSQSAHKNTTMLYGTENTLRFVSKWTTWLGWVAVLLKGTWGCGEYDSFPFVCLALTARHLQQKLSGHQKPLFKKGASTLLCHHQHHHRFSWTLLFCFFHRFKWQTKNPAYNKC